MSASPRFSRVSKLDGIASWSLPAVRTCPGAYADDGSLVEICNHCYATAGNYRFTNVRATRDHNVDDWRNDDWTDAMVALLDDHRYFRWFDSGDVSDYRLALKILDVIERTPWCKHWLPTRSHKFGHIRVVLAMINRLPNAVVRYSADNFDECQSHHGAIVVSSPERCPKGVHLCEATVSRKQCDGCRQCWDPSVKTVAYVAHGQKAKSTLRRRGEYFDLAT